jgi:hypothetical protein
MLLGSFVFPVSHRYSVLFLHFQCMRRNGMRILVVIWCIWTDCDDLRFVMVSKPALVFIILFFLPFIFWWLLSHLQNFLVIALLDHGKMKAFDMWLHLVLIFCTCFVIIPGCMENTLNISYAWSRKPKNSVML